MMQYSFYREYNLVVPRNDSKRNILRGRAVVARQAHLVNNNTIKLKTIVLDLSTEVRDFTIVQPVGRWFDSIPRY